jgi:hypothetical protein
VPPLPEDVVLLPDDVVPLPEDVVPLPGEPPPVDVLPGSLLFAPPAPPMAAGRVSGAIGLGIGAGGAGMIGTRMVTGTPRLFPELVCLLVRR